jgi:hypothetical protein
LVIATALVASMVIAVDIPLSSIPKDVNAPVTFTAPKVAVPVNVGPAWSALVAIEAEIASNSTSNSVPLMIFPGSPEGKASFTSKSVVLV